MLQCQVGESLAGEEKKNRNIKISKYLGLQEAAAGVLRCGCKGTAIKHRGAPSRDLWGEPHCLPQRLPLRRTPTAAALPAASCSESSRFIRSRSAPGPLRGKWIAGGYWGGGGTSW